MKKTKKIDINKLVISKLNNPSLIYARTGGDCQASTKNTEGENLSRKLTRNVVVLDRLNQQCVNFD